jgi:integrase
MRVKIDADFVKEVKPKERPIEARDTILRGFILRVQPSGVKTYLVEYARHKRIVIGQAAAISAAEARKEAGKRIAEYIKGTDPMEAKKAARAFTLETFVAERYRPWAESNLKHSKETLRKISVFYPDFGSKRLNEVTAWGLEKYRSSRLKGGTSPSTVNRELDTLRAALSKAVQWGLLSTHPMATVKRSRVDSSATIRYLSAEEGKRLRAALDDREGVRRKQREDFNAWRRERGYDTFPEYQNFTDHLKPIALLAINTGLRRGEIFNLKWADIDFVGRILTVTGKTAKSGKTRHIPLNAEAYSVLQGWFQQRGAGDLVFPARDGGRLDNITSAWERLLKQAEIEGFRFHDLRHDFASKLVMAGVDLNTVRELLGHSDIKMTLRYAHLAPEKLAAAVAKLGNG